MSIIKGHIARLDLRKVVWMWLIFLFLLFPYDSFAQTQFVRAVGGTGWDYGRSVVLTDDGGYAVSGRTYNYGAGNADCFLVKFNSLGILEWARVVGGADDDYGRCLARTIDGGYIIGGWTRSFGAGDWDVLIIKFDSSGGVVWCRAIGGSEYDYCWHIIQTADSGYAAVGATGSYGAGSSDIFLIKLDSDGNLEWANCVGGTFSENAECVVHTLDGGYAVAGYSYTFSVEPGMTDDMLLIKFDSLGSVEWTRVAGVNGYDEAYSLVQTPDSGFAMTGLSYVRDLAGDLFITRYDNLGTMMWFKILGNFAVSNTEYGKSIIWTDDSSFVIAGETYSFGAGSDDMLLTKFNGLGNWEWSYVVGGTNSDRAISVKLATDGGYISAGGTRSYGAGLGDVLLVKFDSDGRTCVGENIFPDILDTSLTTRAATPLSEYVSPTVSIIAPEILDTMPILTEICTYIPSGLTLYPRGVNSCSWFSFWVRNDHSSEIAESTWVSVLPIRGTSCILHIDCDTTSYDCLADTAAYVYDTDISPGDSSYVTFFFCPNPDSCAEGDSICFRAEAFTSNPSIPGDVDTICFALADCDSCLIVPNSCAMFHPPLMFSDTLVLPCDSSICVSWSVCGWSQQCWGDTVFLFYDLYVDDSIVAESLYSCPEWVCDSTIDISFDEPPLCPLTLEPGDTHTIYMIAYRECDSAYSDTHYVVVE
ncbi:hypothetical protein DRQ26_03995, partial [bacterium]